MSNESGESRATVERCTASSSVHLKAPEHVDCNASSRSVWLDLGDGNAYACVHVPDEAVFDAIIAAAQKGKFYLSELRAQAAKADGEVAA